MKYALGLIGAGKMGGAIVSAVADKGFVDAADILACDAREEALAPLAERGMAVTGNPLDIATESRTILIAVKPQDFDALLKRIAPALQAGQLVISIAAGKTLATMRTLLGSQPHLVRVMPNLAAQVSEGVMSYAADAGVTPDELKFVRSLLSACGKPMELAETLFDAVTALGGSGPAFFAFALEAMAKGGEALGFTPETANAIALQTMLGTAKYLDATKQDTAAFIKAVCSPHGTTEAGMKVLAGSQVAAVFAETLFATAKRSAELAGNR